jgi:hypothetical protein
MKDLKYGRVLLEGKTDTPGDEPCFVLRGQDALAHEIVLEYAKRAAASGASEAFVRSVKSAAMELAAWPVKKLPD